MKTSHPSSLFFMILITLPSLSLLIGDRTNGEAVQNEQTLASVATPDTPLGPHNAGPAVTFKVRSLLETQVKSMARELMKQKGGPEHIQDLGFFFGSDVDGPRIESLLEVTSVDDNPFPIYEVGLDKLRAFTPGTNVENLLIDTNQLLYPIKVNQEVKSSMTLRCVRDRQTGVEEKEEGACWRLTRVGLPKLIDRLTKAKTKLAAQKPGLEQSVRLVSIPALNRNFLGYKENTINRFIPLTKDQHFTEGESYLAQDVIKWLSKEANNMDDSPR